MSGAHFKQSASVGSTGTMPAVIPPVSATADKNIGSTKKHKHVGAKVAAGFVLAAAVVYIGGTVYFSGHYFPGTSVSGDDISFQSPQNYGTALTTKSQNYTAHVEGYNLSLDIKGSDIDLTADGAALASDVKAQQNAFAWPVEIFKTHSTNGDATISFNADKVAALLSPQIAEVNKNATQPTNATLKFDEKDNKFAIVDDVAGTALDEATTTEFVKDGIKALQTTINLSDKCLVQPAITASSDTIKNAQSAANAYMVGDVNLTFAGQTAATVTNKEIGQWVVLAADGSATLNADAIASWANDTLAPKLNTVGTERTYTRPDGKQITVSGGYYGWQIDPAGLARKITDQIKAGSNEAIEIPASQAAGAWNGLGKQDWSNTYVDVDLSAQHAIMYKDAQVVWESDFVSGNTAKGYDSPTGVYSVNEYKGRNQTLIGLDYNHDGQPDYKSHVDYWISFKDNMVAFHDAPWRGSFGGNIYTYNGSHGCINLPSQAAAQLYDLADVGTVVVVHN